MAIHLAYVKPSPVDPGGTVLDRNDPNTTIGQMMRASTVMIVLAGATAPNATGSQTIEQYLAAEDAAGFHLRHMDNHVIVTSDTA